jgi:type I restriction enzyme, S subunit
MNPENLLQHFERLSEAPDAIARLRRFILDLAVRGKLVAQDPNDEPAAELLKRIQVEKEKLGLTPRRKGAKKSEKAEQETLGDLAAWREGPYSIPTNWEWSTLESITTKTGSGSTPRGGQAVYENNGILFLRSQNIYNDGLHLFEVAYIDEITHLKMGATAVSPGDLLLNITGGSIGRCCRIPDTPIQANISQHVAIIRLAIPGMRDFLHKTVLSPFFQSFVIDEQTGAGRGGLPKNRMDGIPIPLPPLAEQHRIVAKVDELMALCDQLQAAQTEREQSRDRLVAASLHQLQNSNGFTPRHQDANRDEKAEPENLGPLASRRESMFLQNLPRLTTRPAHIKQLRQTILNLAVRGKLVEQDLNDEPASELLKRIQVEKTKLAKEGKYRGTTSVTTLPKSNISIEIPDNWVWVSFGEIMISRDGERIPVSKEERNTRAKQFDYYGASGVIDKIDNYLFDKPLLLIGEDGANLINRSTPIAFIARGKYWVNNHAHVLDGISEKFLRFMELQINAIDLKPYVTGTAQPKMNQAKMNSIQIALPPESEQYRIVAKVDELMELCDQLETQLTTTEADSRRLLEAVLYQVLAPTSKETI